MSGSPDISQVNAGDEVFGSEGEKVGTVAEVQRDYLVVEKGFFFPTDYYIPYRAVQSVDRGQLFLAVTKDAALNSGWDVVPDVTATSAQWTEEATLPTDREVGQARQPATAAYEATTEDELVIPVREEELTAAVREREAGAVRVEKRVVEEDQVLEVPVTEEQIRVERRVVDRPLKAADAGAFEEIVIEVPLTSEEVELRKQARVIEEVVVSKEAIQRTEQVGGTVRREEVVVDEDALSDPRSAARGEQQAF